MKKLLVALLMVPAMAHAEFWTGNKLYDRLNSNEPMERVQGLGYVMGVYDVGEHLIFCPGLSGNIAAGQVRDMVFNWLGNNPHRRHESAEKLILDMFRQVWPCKNSKSGTRL